MDLGFRKVPNKKISKISFCATLSGIDWRNPMSKIKFPGNQNAPNRLNAALSQSFLDKRWSEPQKRLAHKSLFSKKKWLSKKFSRKKFCSKKIFSKVCRRGAQERKPGAGVEWKRPAPTTFGKKLLWTEIFFMENFLTTIFLNKLLWDKCKKFDFDLTETCSGVWKIQFFAIISKTPQVFLIRFKAKLRLDWCYLFHCWIG